MDLWSSTYREIQVKHEKMEQSGAIDISVLMTVEARTSLGGGSP